MRKYEVRTANDAIAYLADCSLATVCGLAGKKSASKSELRRQISIAQQAMDWGRQFGADFSQTRGHDVMSDFGGRVEDWAEQWKP